MNKLCIQIQLQATFHELLARLTRGKRRENHLAEAYALWLELGDLQWLSGVPSLKADRRASELGDFFGCGEAEDY